MQQQNKTQTFGSFQLNQSKVFNKGAILRQLQNFHRQSKTHRQPPTVQFNSHVPKHVEIDDDVLNYVDSFKNLADLVNTHKVKKWDGGIDTEFTKEIIADYSELYNKDLRHQESNRTKSECLGSTFQNKLTLFGIVEATFGGQRGYQEKIIAEDLTGSVGKLEDLSGKINEKRQKRLAEYDQKWIQMYKRS